MHQHQLYQPYVTTEYHFHSYFVDSIRLWNSLPAEIVELGSDLASDLAFKRWLQKYLTVR